ncbi:MAG: transporter substrate-binding domain-containing protein, partial [Oscillospiraceae bacterium]
APTINAAERDDEAALQPVTIGYIDYDNFISLDSDGDLQGYAYEYIKEIAKYTNRTYVFQPIEWPDVMDSLQKGKIDLYLDAMYTTDRILRFDYSSFPIIQQEMMLYTLSRSPYYYADFEHFDGKRIGILRSGCESLYLAQYAQENGFSFIISEYDSNADMQSALEAGEVDLIAANNFIKKDNYKMVGVYGITPVFALSKKGEPFVKELDRAIQGIKINSPNFEDDLYEKYYGQKVNFIASGFTREESKYIATLGNIKVGVFDHFSPLSYLDSKGKFVGVYIDILDQLSSVSGICFEPIALDPEMDTAQALESGKCDIIMGVNSQLGDTYPSMALSNYFMVSETSAVGRIDTEHDFNQALDIVLLRNLSGSAVSKAKLNSAIHFTFAHSPKECLLMVEKGDTDISILNSYVAN